MWNQYSKITGTLEDEKKVDKVLTSSIYLSMSLLSLSVIQDCCTKLGDLGRCGLLLSGDLKSQYTRLCIYEKTQIR